ncbi:MAG: GNAT family N-acetyltransferase, partial [Alphaproteobacteria bacterium]
ASYARALDEILASDFTRLIVVEFDGAVVGSLQLTLIPHLSYVGQRRAIFESVHVAPAFQGKGAGAFMVAYAIDAARKAGCGQIVLTSSNSRIDAHRFWKRMGFEPTHVGMKLHLK